MTKQGDRCKREAGDKSEFCSIHVDQEVRERTPRSSEWDTEAIMTAALGLALVGAIFLLRIRR